MASSECHPPGHVTDTERAHCQIAKTHILIEEHIDFGIRQAHWVTQQSAIIHG
ncbi:MAG TPA: hypothetical protein VL996_10645 [Methylocella sp.]|nr:hypothetical protein [Methylocella sp.]